MNNKQFDNVGGLTWGFDFDYTYDDLVEHMLLTFTKEELHKLLEGQHVDQHGIMLDYQSRGIEHAILLDIVRESLLTLGGA